jgi:hypothetical protein
MSLHHHSSLLDHINLTVWIKVMSKHSGLSFEMNANLFRIGR